MGSPASESGRASDENLVPRTITSFFLKTSEVTHSEWTNAGYGNPSHFITCGSGCPVERVNWWEALHYANFRSGAEGLPACHEFVGCNSIAVGSGRECTGAEIAGGAELPVQCRGYRLPTEAEWEYAYRSGTATAFYSGGITQPTGNDPNLNLIGWYSQNAGNTTRAVGGKTANAWGLRDMPGNVAEWVWDWYGSTHESSSTPDFAGPSAGTLRIHRGGSWTGNAQHLRAAARSAAAPTYSSYNVGFRLARTAP